MSLLSFCLSIRVHVCFSASVRARDLTLACQVRRALILTEWLWLFDTLRNTSLFQASLYLLFFVCVRVFRAEANDTSIKQKAPIREYSGVAFELRMFGRATAPLSSAHVRVNDKGAHARRTLAVRDVGQDAVEVLDLLAPRLISHHTPILGLILRGGA